MNASFEQVGNLLEQLIADRRARIAGAIVVAAVLLMSMGFLVAAKSSPTRSAASLAAHLPAYTLQIPILRSLPEPQPRKATRAPRAESTSGRYVALTARR